MPEKRAGAPEWASFFTAEQYAVFLECVHRHFAERNTRVSIDEGVLRLKAATEGAFGLLNLAQICRAAEEHDWPRIVQEHFDEVLAAYEGVGAPEARIADFEAVSDRVAVRVWPEGLLAELGRKPDEMLIWRSDMEGTVTVLVLDLPTSVKNIRPDEAAPWGKSTGDLFALGLANLPKLCTPRVVLHDLPNGQPSRLLTGDELYVASYALLLDGFPECVGTHGALVGVPNRHAVISCPIEDLRIVGALGVTIQAVCAMAQQGPGTITDNVYWYRDGKFTQLPYEIDGNELNFEPPDEFVEMLNGLGEPED